MCIRDSANTDATPTIIFFMLAPPLPFMQFSVMLCTPFKQAGLAVFFTKSVSYTHLDVYKRQVQCRAWEVSDGLLIMLDDLGKFYVNGGGGGAIIYTTVR